MEDADKVKLINTVNAANDVLFISASMIRRINTLEDVGGENEEKANNALIEILERFGLATDENFTELYSTFESSLIMPNTLHSTVVRTSESFVVLHFSMISGNFSFCNE